MFQSLTKSFQITSARCYGTTVNAVKRKPSGKKVKQQETNTNGIITCKRSEFNLLVPERESSKFGTIPLASNGWLHYKSKKDFFTINAIATENEQHSQMIELNEWLKVAHAKLAPQLQDNLRNALQITKLTQVQTEGITKIYNSHHTLIAAETGCGKTVTYLLPIIQQLLERQRSSSSSHQQEQTERKLNTPLVLIITPGRELASQIGNVAEKLCTNTNLKVKTVLGGRTKQIMLNPDFDDIHILVATMGAICKLVATGIYRMGKVQHVVLDEADTLLDDSFTEKLIKLLERFPFHKNHMQNEIGTQLILASATMPTNTQQQLSNVIDVTTLHSVVSPNLHKIMPHVQQKFLRMSKIERPNQLLSLVHAELAQQRPIIIFSNKSVSSDYVSMFLNDSGIHCLNLNGDMLMKIRLGRFEQFQNGECDVLSTTDVGSRGLDTTRARHVINFDFPLHVSDYIHRCGRIGRIGLNASQQCFVTNFISSRREIEPVQRIEHAARTGGLLSNVNANINALIKDRIIKEMKAAGIEPPKEKVEKMVHEEVF